jgi:hypothetical protein
MAIQIIKNPYISGIEKKHLDSILFLKHHPNLLKNSSNTTASTNQFPFFRTYLSSSLDSYDHFMIQYILEIVGLIISMLWCEN